MRTLRPLLIVLLLVIASDSVSAQTHSVSSVIRTLAEQAIYLRLNGVLQPTARE